MQTFFVSQYLHVPWEKVTETPGPVAIHFSADLQQELQKKRHDHSDFILQDHYIITLDYLFHKKMKLFGPPKVIGL